MSRAGVRAISPGDKVAIFWGGGLGDVLTLRPMLLALDAVLDTPPSFFTTSTHLQSVFSELGLRVNTHILPVQPTAALDVFRRLRIRFDWLYLGPYPRIKTRMLAHVIRPRRIWCVRHSGVDPFLGEQVLADVEALGLRGPDGTDQPYGGKWHWSSGPEPAEAPHPYLVLHPGAKERWETTRWPEAYWAELIRKIVLETDFELRLVGVPSERPQLEAMLEKSELGASSRVRVQADISLLQLAATLDCSSGVICHNSGILHLAAMLGKGTVAVTGSSAIFWRPPYAHVANVTSGACNIACNQYKCPVPFFHAKCIRRLQVVDVMAAVREKLLAGMGR
ncbi:MAG TPA: glycosyltransferase family 9 protein [Gammaproteobacteria bacterium]|nr:glycosyltransferase family 9 protein [Gammaproteobacteria bacterium]